MKRYILGLLVALIVLAATNPSHERHQQRFDEQIRDANPLLKRLGIGGLGSLLVSYQSYGVLSVGRVADEVVSVGVLGQVFMRDRDG